jgi:spermidine/putrescine transport system substrate-binding protein
MGYSSPNAEVFKFLPSAMKENSIVNPPVQNAARGEFLDSLDEKTLKLYEQYWVRLKTK